MTIRWVSHCNKCVCVCPCEAGLCCTVCFLLAPGLPAPGLHVGPETVARLRWTATDPAGSRGRSRQIAAARPAEPRAEMTEGQKGLESSMLVLAAPRMDPGAIKQKVSSTHIPWGTLREPTRGHITQFRGPVVFCDRGEHCTECARGAVGSIA